MVESQPCSPSPSALPLMGDEQGRIPLKEDALALLGNKEIPLLPKCGYCFPRGVFSQALMAKIANYFHSINASKGINIFNENWPSWTTAADQPVRIMYPATEEGSPMHEAAALLASLYDTHLGLTNPVFYMKAGTTMKQCWHRDVVGSFLFFFEKKDERQLIALFPVLEATPNDGNAGDLVLAGHLGLPDPFKVLPIAPLPVDDAWAAAAQMIHGGGDSPIWVLGQGSCVCFCVTIQL